MGVKKSLQEYSKCILTINQTYITSHQHAHYFITALKISQVELHGSDPPKEGQPYKTTNTTIRQQATSHNL
jgi:hypothetical protein